MTDTARPTCAPPAGTATDTWHWLQYKSAEQVPYRWINDPEYPWWSGLYDAEFAHTLGYTYVGPVAPYVAATVPMWEPMETASRDGTAVLLQLKTDLPERSDLVRWRGLMFVGSHPGIASDGSDIGWSFAAPVGQGGFPNEWFVGWRPLLAPPTAQFATGEGGHDAR